MKQTWDEWDAEAEFEAMVEDMVQAVEERLKAEVEMDEAGS